MEIRNPNKTQDEHVREYKYTQDEEDIVIQALKFLYEIGEFTQYEKEILEKMILRIEENEWENKYTMTVDSLIQVLQKCDPSKLVFIDIDDEDLYYIDNVRHEGWMGETDFNILLECKRKELY